ncbi:MAG TPA: TetR/AcrR family transcriptional regulator [Kofleriaceae bacterium]|jgi:TetR/AcrR family transcriptional repressor of lmrAB and yxaGH operons|nr:TetR/AcrR family transcriptional regulator [Kofleriaceae bacterium]
MTAPARRARPGPGPANPAVPTRDRIVVAATQLFQQRGYHAVSTADILDHARAPRGSMYHHFPLGKEQIAVAAVTRIRGEVLALLRTLQARGRSLEDTLRVVADGMARWLRTSEWREGTMLASTAVGATPELPELHAAIRGAFAAWCEHLTGRLVDGGWDAAAARAMSQTIVAGIEGAMILARIDQDERIVPRVAAMLARLIATGNAPRRGAARTPRSRRARAGRSGR